MFKIDLTIRELRLLGVALRIFKSKMAADRGNPWDTSVLDALAAKLAAPEGPEPAEGTLDPVRWFDYKEV